MCIKSEFPISGNLTLVINEDCSVTLRDYVLDEELGGPDFDIINFSKENASKIAKILVEELGFVEQNQSFATDDCDLPTTSVTTMTEEEEK